MFQFLHNCENTYKVNRLTFSDISTDTHKRYALYAVVPLILVVIAALVGAFVHRLTKSEGAGLVTFIITY